MTIIAAVDRTDRATAVIAEAEILSKTFEETVHVVHVLTQSEFIDLERTSYNETGTALDMDEIRAVGADIAADAARDLEVPFESVGLVGNAASRIVEYARGQDARYIVISGHKRSPAGKAIFGSDAQSVLLNADCPVVTVFTK